MMYLIGTTVQNSQKKAVTFFQGGLNAIKRAQDVASRLLFSETPKYNDSSIIRITEGATCPISMEELQNRNLDDLMVPSPNQQHSKSYYEITPNGTVDVSCAIPQSELLKMDKNSNLQGKCPVSREKTDWTSLNKLSEMDLTSYIKTTQESSSIDNLVPTDSKSGDCIIEKTVKKIDSKVDKFYAEINKSLDDFHEKINKSLDDFGAKHAETKELIADIIDSKTSTDERISKLGSLCDHAIKGICEPPINTIFGLSAATWHVWDAATMNVCDEATMKKWNKEITGAKVHLNTAAKHIFNNENFVEGFEDCASNLVKFFNG